MILACRISGKIIYIDLGMLCETFFFFMWDFWDENEYPGLFDICKLLYMWSSPQKGWCLKILKSRILMKLDIETYVSSMIVCTMSLSPARLLAPCGQGLCLYCISNTMYTKHIVSIPLTEWKTDWKLFLDLSRYISPVY